MDKKEYQLSVLIPARCEEFLAKTIENILENIESDTEILVGCDGYWPVPEIKDHPRVKILHYSESIGQRAMTNQLCRLSTAKYIMKLDAHCAVDKGFDRKMIEKMEDDITMVPVMRNLHAFNWVCIGKNLGDGNKTAGCGEIRYQGPSGVCTKCGGETKKDICWIAKTNPQSTAYRFDKDMHFQYWNDFGKKQKGELTETLSIQGSCFMLTREKYWELDICSEEFGSWGQQGVEVACKTHLSGGRVLVNRNTWYAHMFRTQGGDFGFPYHNPESLVKANRTLSKELFLHNKWKGARYDFNWLLRKFNPPDWEESQPTKGILYYSDNQLNMSLAGKVRKQIKKANLPITSVTLKPTVFGYNIHYKSERSFKTMANQILTGLKAMKEDIVYFSEHDVFYHPDHFKFTPSSPNTWYYNGNYWFVRANDGFAVHYDASPLSGLVVYRESAIKHFEERVKMIEELGDDYKPLHMGFEPFTQGRVKWDYWCPFEVFMPENPNIDITHGNNLTWKRWKESQFIKKPKFWEEGLIIPGWGTYKEILEK